MLRIKRTNAKDPQFIKLVRDLDEFLAVTDGEDHAFYDRFNQLGEIKHALLIFLDDEVIGCGAIKKFGDRCYEVKRMFVVDIHRGNGYAGVILKGLEDWARDLGASSCVLETGVRQKAAVHLYQKSGYSQIDNYGQYVGVQNSICFEKKL